jgi:hypothetical protein
MTHDDLQQALKRGMDMARDPRNAHARGPRDVRVTTIYSPWLFQICRVCHHTFREDDIVLPNPAHPDRMLHDDPQANLRCWHKAQRLPVERAATARYDDNLRLAFMRGVSEYWQPAGAQAAERVAAGSDLIGRKCPICRHTVRIGDQVVRCPCGRACGGVFHQDIARHLTCWHSWHRGEKRGYCAFTGAQFVLPESEAAG